MILLKKRDFKDLHVRELFSVVYFKGPLKTCKYLPSLIDLNIILSKKELNIAYF